MNVEIGKIQKDKDFMISAAIFLVLIVLFLYLKRQGIEI